MCDKFENELKNPDEWVEIFPYGLTMGLASNEPLFLFKDSSEKLVLPIYMEQHEAHLALLSNSRNTTCETSMELPFQLLKDQGLKIEKAFINEIKSHQQYMTLNLRSDEGKFTRVVRVDQGLALCLRMNTEFYTTYGHVKRLREIRTEAKNNSWAKELPLIDMEDRSGYLN